MTMLPPRQLLSQRCLFEQHFPDYSARSLRNTQIRWSGARGLIPIFTRAVVLVCFVSEGVTRGVVGEEAGEGDRIPF